MFDEKLLLLLICLLPRSNIKFIFGGIHDKWGDGSRLGSKKKGGSRPRGVTVNGTNI
jgi:hypothetical protein